MVTRITITNFDGMYQVSEGTDELVAKVYHFNTKKGLFEWIDKRLR